MGEEDSRFARTGRFWKAASLAREIAIAGFATVRLCAKEPVVPLDGRVSSRGSTLILLED